MYTYVLMYICMYINYSIQDKSSETSIAYWFRAIDLDAGVFSLGFS